LLLEQLRDAPGDRQLPEIAQRLGLLPGQLKKWLKQAVEEGKVARKPQGRRWVYLDAALQEGKSVLPDSKEAGSE
jgi:transposase-like protein